MGAKAFTEKAREQLREEFEAFTGRLTNDAASMAMAEGIQLRMAKPKPKPKPYPSKPKPGK